MKKNFNLKMKMVFLLLTLMPFFGMSQAKNVISTNRVFPKVDKLLEFEKALATHAQKYHTGDVKWRVFDIQSGPDAGGYHIVEGPKSWESEDSRGDINEAHNNDWHKSVTVFFWELKDPLYLREWMKNPLWGPIIILGLVMTQHFYWVVTEMGHDRNGP